MRELSPDDKHPELASGIGPLRITIQRLSHNLAGLRQRVFLMSGLKRRFQASTVIHESACSNLNSLQL